MSRTDHHAPDWVRATWWEPVHVRCVNSTRYHWTMLPGGQECDLPDEPIVSRDRPRLSRWRNTTGRRCFWEPDEHFVRPYSRQPRWFVEHFWHNPERVRTRDTLRAAVADWRANGDTDLEPDTRQARHCARWAWS